MRRRVFVIAAIVVLLSLAAAVAMQSELKVRRYGYIALQKITTARK